LAAVGGVALLCVSAAGADKVRTTLTAEGQADARAVVIERADLDGVWTGAASTGVWTGGAYNPPGSSATSCPGYHPKLSDLVAIGDAGTRWKTTGIEIMSAATVMKTAAMVRLDWRRNFTPKLLPCLRHSIETSAHSASQRLVSVRKIAFPHVAPRTFACRTLIDVKTATATVRGMADVLFFAKGRTEFVLSYIGLAKDAKAARQTEIMLARLLAARVQT
jgi:hypothetical protein